METKTIKLETKMNPQGGVFGMWRPQQGISGSANAGRVWIESINSLKQTAVVRYDCKTGMRSRAYCARIADLTFGEPWK